MGRIFSGQSAVAHLGATIAAGNTGGPNCSAGAAGSVDSAGYNLTSDKTGKACACTAATDLVNRNPALGHLASNGGPTKTLLPAATSPADDVILSVEATLSYTGCTLRHLHYRGDPGGQPRIGAPASLAP